jgi:transposase-like protein
VELA